MEIIGTVVNHPNADANAPTDAQNRRLGLKRELHMSWPREDGDHDFYLFADQGLVLNIEGQAKVVLTLEETARLATFMRQPDVEAALMAIVRASLLKNGGPAARRLIRLVDSLPEAERRRIADAVGA